jgi:hypothetical protein
MLMQRIQHRIDAIAGQVEKLFDAFSRQCFGDKLRPGTPHARI